MASLMLRQVARRCIFTHALMKRPIINQSFAHISTSKKNKDVTIVSESSEVSEPWQKEVEHEVATKTKNWISYGYSLTDRNEDEWVHMVVMFLGITLCCVGGSFIVAYLPDQKMKDWSAREAFLELARRENEGLPLVDCNYISDEQMLSQLPTDEQLGETEIVI